MYICVISNKRLTVIKQPMYNSLTIIRMRKVLIFTVFMIFSSVFLFSQNVTRDVVHLKNGSVIKGNITEQVPGQSITIETADGNVFVLSIEDVSKITKETEATKAVKVGKSPAEGKNRYSYFSLNLGVATDFDHVGLGLNLLELNLATQRGLGGTLKWGANSYLVDEVSYGTGYLLVGPSYSHLINMLNIKATYRALVGYAVPSVTYDGKKTTGDGLLAFNLGATLRFAAHKRFNFVLAPDVLLIDGEPALNVNAGFAFSW